MWNFKWNRKRVPKYLKRNKIPSGTVRSAGKAPVPGKSAVPDRLSSAELDRMQKNITRQAMLAGLTVVLTIVILFAMTSAWYTNIVQTSGLVFEAESWGFDGQITVNESPIVAAPGEEGTVHLEVQNTSTNISAISVNVNKQTMDEEMRKRLFFYVDTHMNRDGETMERVYLNNQEGYTYTVFSNGTLTLTDKAANAPQLKWQWVYDVLGYYVLAEPIYDEDGDFRRMQIHEYLRPIEYDFDQATLRMGTDENGSPVMDILTVDGTNSPGAYMEIISQFDGYEGRMNREVQIGGYYPVNSKNDKMEYGVYAYLCNYSEIEQATGYDTLLGNLAYEQNVKGNKLEEKDAARLRHTATLNISAQQNESTAINVTSLSALQNTISTGKADVIQLSDNITIPSGESLTIPKNSRVMVDLNGNTITCQSDKAVNGEPGSSLTLLNGTVNGPGSDGTTYGVYTTGSEVVMSNVAVNDFRYGVYIGDQMVNNPLDSRIHMVGCTVDAGWYAVYINGNGSQSAQKTQLIIENTTLYGSGYAITGSGNTDRSGTDIQILNNSIISQKPNAGETSLKPGAAIFHPQKDSTLYIEGSTVSGYTAIALKGGTLDIVDSTISGVGIESITPTQENVSKSGFVDTADAVYIEANYGYEIGLQISGDSKLTSETGQSLRVFEPQATNVTVKIESGTFDEVQPTDYLAETSTQSAKDGKYVVTAADATK